MIRPLIVAIALLLTATAQASMAEHSHRGKIAGVDLITYRTNVKDVVVIVGALPAGDAMAGSGNIAVPTVSGMMLDRGTKREDKYAISDKLTAFGAEISFEVGSQSLDVRAKCLRKDLPVVLGLIAEELRSPALSAEEFNKAKQQFLGALQASTQNSGARAREAFDRAIYPAGHPNRPHTLAEYEAAAQSVTLAEVAAFQAKYYGPAHFTLVVAGDVIDADVRKQLGKSFAGWSGGQDYIRPTEPATAAPARQVQVPLKDKPSVTVMLGAATGLQYRDADAMALRVGTAVLGRGFTGRLMGTVRDKEGLTYSIGAAVGDDSLTDGSWDISASFAPALLDKGLASTRREFKHWWEQGITAEELLARKQGLIGGYQVGLSTTAGLAGQILVNAQRGYDVPWLDEYPKVINSLTREQVNAAIKKHLNPDNLVLVEAGGVPKASGE